MLASWANYGEPPLFSFEISGVRQQFKKSQKISETRYKFIIRPIRTKSLVKNNVFTVFHVIVTSHHIRNVKKIKLARETIIANSKERYLLKVCL